MENHHSLKELAEALSPYLSVNAIARLSHINESQMRQYVMGIRNPSADTIQKINDGLGRFGKRLERIKLGKS